MSIIGEEKMTLHSSKKAFTLLAWVMLVTGLPILTWAQQPSTAPRYYDQFTEHWLNPAKWQAVGPYALKA